MTDMQRKQTLLAKYSGFGLLELMIAMVIGLILMAGVIELYIGNKAAYQTSEAMSRLQENARYAMYQLQKDIRMAGYVDCAPNMVSHLDPAGTGYDDTLFNLDQAVGGWEYTSGGGTGPGVTYSITTLSPTGEATGNWDDQDGSDIPTGLQDRIVPGTDVITMKSLGSADSVSVNDGNLISATSIVLRGSATQIVANQILLATQDCNSSDLFQTTSAASPSTLIAGVGSSSPGNGDTTIIGTLRTQLNSNAWTQVYGPGARVLPFQSRAYYIGMQGSDEHPALYRVSFNTGVAGTHEKLVDGVESMQILYGEDTDSPEDGIANIYRTINNVTDGEQVSSVRISLLMRTLETVAADDDTKADYLLTGHSAATATQINPINDRYLRYVFSSTIKLRNRGSL